MSDDHNDQASMTDLTPFEAALADVDTSSYENSPSLAVVANLRQLLAQVDDAPISQARLREFVEDENAIGRRGAKRSIMRRNVTARSLDDDAFIDITPAGLSNSGADLFAASTDDIQTDDIQTDDIQTDDIQTDDIQTDDLAIHEVSLDAIPTDEVAIETESDPPILFPGIPDLEPSAYDTAYPDAAYTDTTYTDFTTTESTVVERPELVETAQYEQLAAAESSGDNPDDANLVRLPSITDDDSNSGIDLDAESGILAHSDDRFDPIDSEPPAVVMAGVIPLNRPALAGKAAALFASAAAAAVLLVGGLWWANNLGGNAETAAAGTQATETSAGARSSGSDPTVDPSLNPTDEINPLPSEARSTTSGVEPAETTAPEGSPETFAPETTGETKDSQDPDARPDEGETDPTSEEQDPATEADTTVEAETTEATQETKPPTTEAPAPETTKPPVEPTETTMITKPTLPTFEPDAEQTPQAPTALAYIGDKVYLGGWSGPGVGGITVELFRDSNENGQANFRVASQTTSSAGRYSFNVGPGCYVVRFTAPGGFYVDSDYQNRALCVEPGEIRARIDSIVYQLTRAPDGCAIDLDDDGGVEVYETDGDWAPSYSFYNANGNLVAETKNMGGADDIDSSSDREWWGYSNGFDHLSVTWVTAERNGMVSEWVRCARGT